MNNHVTLIEFWSAIVISLLVGGGVGAVFFDGTNSTPSATTKTPAEKLEVAEKEAARLTNRLNSRQRQEGLWKDRYDKASKELREAKTTLEERRGEVAQLNAKNLGFERKLDRLLGRNARNETQSETVKTYRVRFQVRTQGRRRSRGINNRPAITKEVEAISFNDARKKIREQYQNAQVVTIEIVE